MEKNDTATKRIVFFIPVRRTIGRAYEKETSELARQYLKKRSFSVGFNRFFFPAVDKKARHLPVAGSVKVS
ncbi:MAG: hypothetical protein CMO55_23500 [Verrucomicrobiales bacterium]|nr:hypothetical protein [Verrucomicrobiales bacterium]